jgi:hypothetical protein
MKMEPNKKYRVPLTIPLSSISALDSDLDTINSHIIQAVKHLHIAGDMTFDLSRKLKTIKKDNDAWLPKAQED